MILFVGDAPSPKMKPGARPFEGAACEARLKEWIYELEINACQIINSAGKYWSVDAIVASYNNHKIIALGNNASKRLSKLQIDHFKLPHPSGLNRQINDKEFIAKKLNECKIYLKSSG